MRRMTNLNGTLAVVDGDLFEAANDAMTAPPPAPEAQLELGPVLPLRDRPFERLLPRTLTELYAMLNRQRRLLRAPRFSKVA